MRLSAALALLLALPAAAAVEAVPLKVVSATFPLEHLRTEGFAILPPGSLMTPEEEAAVRASLRGPDGRPLEHRLAVEAAFSSAGGFMTRLDEGLKAVIPDEHETFSRARKKGLLTVSPNSSAHIDGAYLTVLHALEGAPTLVYRLLYDGAGRPREIEEIVSPTGSTVVLSNRQRTNSVGILPTIHASPRSGGSERAILTRDYWDPDDDTMGRFFADPALAKRSERDRETVRFSLLGRDLR